MHFYWVTVYIVDHKVTELIGLLVYPNPNPNPNPYLNPNPNIKTVGCVGYFKVMRLCQIATSCHKCVNMRLKTWTL